MSADTDACQKQIADLEDRLLTATLELTAALGYVDEIVTTDRMEVTYETLQRSGFRRKDGWFRKYTLGDARANAKTAAVHLRKAWEALDPANK